MANGGAKCGISLPKPDAWRTRPWLGLLLDLCAHFLRADALRLSDQPAAAIDAYQATLQLDPDHYWANGYLGVLYWQEEANVVAATRQLEKAIAHYPEIRWGYEQLALVYEQNGQATQAIRTYERLLTVVDDATINGRLQQLREQQSG